MGPRILKSKRVLFDLTQEEIAKELGITIKSYNAKENGKREFTLDEAKKISSLLKLNLNEVNDIFFNSAINRKNFKLKLSNLIIFLKGDNRMDNLKVFENDEFGQLSVIVKNNKEYIEAIEVATILGYSNPRDAISRHCNEEGVVFSDVRVVTGIKKDNSKAFKVVTKKFIDEGNLYRLIIKSKLPSARRFEKWVMDEVLPSIRKHGAYMSEEVINKTLDDPDFIIEMATKLKYEREQRRLLEEKAKHLEATITIDKPYTNFGKSIATSSDAITIGQFAKVLNNNNIELKLMPKSIGNAVSNTIV